MKKIKELLGLIIFLAVGVFFYEFLKTNVPKDIPEKIVILHTNDIHCQLEQKIKDGKVVSLGYEGISAYKKEMKELYGKENVTLIDAGDAIQGGAIGTLSKGSYIVDIMNYVGYDLGIPGNHEFDYGMKNFLNLVNEKAKYSYLCSNLTDLNGKTVLKPYEIISYGDISIGYIGITTPESFTKSTPIYFQDENGNYIYSFNQENNGKNFYEIIQKNIDVLKKDKKVDYIVAIGHLGNNGVSEEWSSESVIKNTSGIDIFIDGHSHEEYSKTLKDKEGENVVLAQTGFKLKNLGKITIYPKENKIISELILDYNKQDEETLIYIENIKNKFSNILEKVVAKSEVFLTTVNTSDNNYTVRNSETNLGDFCADAYRIILGADIAFVNGGGIRANIEKGDITYEDIINVQPFGNEMSVVETTGQNILDALEVGASKYPQLNGGFLQVSGFTYTIDSRIPSSVIFNEKGEFVKVNGKYRVNNVLVGKEPLILNKIYKLASHNYILKNGGNGYMMFKGDKFIKDSVILDNEVLINYIVEKLNGIIGEEYKNLQGQGRIKIKDKISLIFNEKYYNKVA